LVNLETGITARINTKQRNKLVSTAALEKSLANGFTAGQHNAAAAIVDRIFKHASLMETAADRGGDVNILSIKRFAAPVLFEQETAIAYLTLKESVEQGHRIYSLELMEIEKPPTKGNTLAGDEHTTAGGSKERIAQLLERVKGFSKINDKNSAELSAEGEGALNTPPDAREGGAIASDGQEGNPDTSGGWRGAWRGAWAASEGGGGEGDHHGD
jgi:hypothetical protein